MDKLPEDIKSLIDKAAQSLDATDAMKFAQAALSAAQALHTLKSAEAIKP